MPPGPALNPSRACTMAVTSLATRRGEGRSVESTGATKSDWLRAERHGSLMRVSETARPPAAMGAATAASTLGADSCYSYSFGWSAGAALSPSWWFHSYLVMRARIQDCRVKSITSLHIVVQPAFSGWDIQPPSRVSE